MSADTAALRLALTVDEAAASLGLDATDFRRHVLPRLRVVRLGDAERVPVCELERLLEGRPAERQRAVDPRTAAQLLSCGRTFFDEHILGQLRVVREGGKVLVPLDEIDYWLGRRRERTRPERRRRSS